MVWPTLGLRKAKEQKRTDRIGIGCYNSEWNYVSGS